MHPLLNYPFNHDTFHEAIKEKFTVQRCNHSIETTQLIKVVSFIFKSQNTTSFVITHQQNLQLIYEFLKTFMDIQ